MPHEKVILGLSDYEIKEIEGHGEVIVKARYTGPSRCPHCQSEVLRTKDSFRRRVRHEDWGVRPCWLELEAHKFQCRVCGRYFNQRFPGILPRRRNTEAFRRSVYLKHLDGIDRQTLAHRERIAPATVERWFHDFLDRAVRERQDAPCPRVLGIDEHFFSRKKGFATTFCDLERHRVYDVALGRSEPALEGYLRHLKGREQVRVVCMDLSDTYRSIIRRYFPNALIVADRFHVIRLINQQFLNLWRLLDPSGSRNRGLLSLMRRHYHSLAAPQAQRLTTYLQTVPALKPVYDFKQRLTRLLLIKHRTARQCRQLIPSWLDHLRELTYSNFPHLEQLGRTLSSWSKEIVRMWRFTRNNGITEGFHTKMELISRRAFGFRNFDNYRLRVRVMCA
jgi:transposase